MSTEPTREPLAIEELLTDDQKRTCTVEEHAAFRASITTRPGDDIDALVEELRAAEFERKAARP